MVDGLAYDDLDPYGREIDDPLAELEQDVVHILLEAFGSNPDAPTRGIGLERALSGQADDALRHRIESELTEDDRIDAARATFSDAGDGSVRIDLEIQANENTLGIAVDIDGNGNVRKVTA